MTFVRHFVCINTIMDISVVMLSWNSKKHLERSVPSLLMSLEGEGLAYELFIVDNDSHDGSKEYLNELKKLYPGSVRPIFLNYNTGTTFSRNIALRRAVGDYIAVMDSDVEVPSAIFNKLITRLKSDTDIGLIAPSLLYPSGRLQKSTDVFPTLWRKVQRFFFLKLIESKEKRQGTGEIEDVDYAISAFWFFPKHILKSVGLLDEKIFYAPEDADYCLRIWKRGYRVVLDREACAIHYAQEISRGMKFNKAFWEHLKGLLYFFTKHRCLFRRPSRYL